MSLPIHMRKQCSSCLTSERLLLKKALITVQILTWNLCSDPWRKDSDWMCLGGILFFHGVDGNRKMSDSHPYHTHRAEGVKPVGLVYYYILRLEFLHRLGPDSDVHSRACWHVLLCSSGQQVSKKNGCCRVLGHAFLQERYSYTC